MIKHKEKKNKTKKTFKANMLITLLSYLLIPNALSLSKDKSLLSSRIVITSLVLNRGLTLKILFVINGYIHTSYE